MNNNQMKLVFLLLFILLLTACSYVTTASTLNNVNLFAANHPDKDGISMLQKPPEHTEKLIESKTITKEISIAAIGDLLIHSSVYQDAQTDEGYDFTPMFEKVKPFLRDATITLANQETMIGGEELGLSSYPRFNSPFEVGDAIHNAGVDVVSLANNHTIDRGEEAVQRALNHWEELGMLYTGSYKDEASSAELTIFHTDQDIDVAFLSYTYGTNGIPIPQGKDYLVNLIDKEKMANDVTRAKQESDVVVLSLHFGNEYERMPNNEQKELVQYAADLGVHAVIGHHPHVLQPMDWVKGKDGNQTLVIYSLGNFLSGQDKFYRQIGGIARFTVEKTVKGKEETINVKAPAFLPTYVSYENWRNYDIIPMYQLTDEQLPGAQKHYQEMKEHMAQWITDLEFIEAH
ncbi:CapA family protein [Aquibacillus albus]|uniref:Poly-gamma-glutamate synthesis protein (Capsule biosynthesis protein) n=1 Tax=Aquibacillus albus TaxID=1168171 RepID=A0ABS2MZI5_9BACI|nr:CapA family protein [Aquibacillus albus]MBM7571095.1 poly-gamma-glutamate synthesis protein (capsule biosynthesis protein) [Aquibacillus albus]